MTRLWRHRLTVLRWIAAPLFVVALVRLADARSVGSTLARLDGSFVTAFLALSVLLYLLSAWRWHFTASRLGAPLLFRRAVSEYYVSTLLNQVLPLGVAGDVVRAARHRGTLADTSWGKPARAVVLERFSGFVGLAVAVSLSVFVWLARGNRSFVFALGAAVAVLLVGALLLLPRAARSSWLGPLAKDARAALFDRGAFAFQLAASLGCIALLLAMFACASRAVGVSLEASAVVQVVPLVLAATTLPWAFGGWGAREAGTALLFGLMGQSVADGVAISITFGLLSLVAAAPGVLVLFLPRLRTRTRPR